MTDIEHQLRRQAPIPDFLPDLTDAAAAAGLLDVAYATFDSPLGTLLLASTPRGLVRLAYLNVDEAEVLEHPRTGCHRASSPPPAGWTSPAANSTSTSRAPAGALRSRSTGG